jgi:hypothetical protein
LKNGTAKRSVSAEASDSMVHKVILSECDVPTRAAQVEAKLLDQTLTARGSVKIYDKRLSAIICKVASTWAARA